MGPSVHSTYPSLPHKLLCSRQPVFELRPKPEEIRPRGRVGIPCLAGDFVQFLRAGFWTGQAFA